MHRRHRETDGKWDAMRQKDKSCSKDRPNTFLFFFEKKGKEIEKAEDKVDQERQRDVEKCSKADRNRIYWRWKGGKSRIKNLPKLS